MTSFALRPWRFLDIVASRTASTQNFSKNIEFGAGALGSFQFGYVQGDSEYRTIEQDGSPLVEFSWEGGDGADGTPLTGRGWAVLEGDGLNGMIFIHRGDESGFAARLAGKKSGRKGR